MEDARVAFIRRFENPIVRGRFQRQIFGESALAVFVGRTPYRRRTGVNDANRSAAVPRRFE